MHYATNAVIYFNAITTIVFFLSISMIYFRSPINSTLCLALILLLSSITLFFLHVEFLSYIFILVYVGGIALLFLFVIIMLNLKADNKKNKDFRIISGSIILFITIFKLNPLLDKLAFSCLFDFDHVFLPTLKNCMELRFHYDIFSVGLFLYTHYFFYFILSGIILLITMICILFIILNGSGKKIQQTNYYNFFPLPFGSGQTIKQTNYYNFLFFMAIESSRSNTLFEIPEFTFVVPVDITVQVAPVPPNYAVSFGVMLYLISILGVLLNLQKNIIVYMLFIELMFFSLSYLTVALSCAFRNHPQGQIFALLIISIAVAESALGLAFLIIAFRTNQKVEFDVFSFLRG